MGVQARIEVDIPALLPSWQRSLRAARRSPRTVQFYTEAAEQLSDFLFRRGMPTAVDSIAREHVESFIEDLDVRSKPATSPFGSARCSSLSSGWSRRAKSPRTPMSRMRAPAIPEDPPALLSDADLRALLKACEGQNFVARRDREILRVFVDTGARLAEVANLRIDNVDLDDQTLMSGRVSFRPAPHPFEVTT